MTAAASRPDKFTYELCPKSGADIWVKGPEDAKGRRMFPDIHLNVDWAEDLAELLLAAVEEAVAANLDLGDG